MTESAYAAPAATNASVYQTAAKSIVFLMAEVQTDKGPDFAAIGTGFFVGLREADRDFNYSFIVTNRHNLLEDPKREDLKKELIYRVNNLDQETSSVKRFPLHYDGPKKNVFLGAPNEDLAVINFPHESDMHINAYDYTYLLPASKYQECDIGFGTEVFTVGLLFSYKGIKANAPLFRYGRIAMMPSEEWYVREKGKPPEKAFLAEFNTTYGASGSPVFLVPGQWSGRQYKMFEPYIVGVVKGKMLSPEDVNDTAGNKLQGVVGWSPIGLASIEYSQQLRNIFDGIIGQLEGQGIKIIKTP